MAILNSSKTMKQIGRMEKQETEMDTESGNGHGKR